MSLLTDKQLELIAQEEEFLLFCDMDGFKQIARHIEAIVCRELRQQLASSDTEVAELKVVSDHNLAIYHKAAELLRAERDKLREDVTLLRDVLDDFDKAAINSKSIIGFAGQSFKLLTKMRKAISATEPK